MDRALIVSGSDKSMEIIAQFLHSYGYTNLSCATSGNEARRMLCNTDFALVIINTPLKDEFGHDFSIHVAETTSAGIVLLCKTDIAEDIADKVNDYGVCVIARPINRAMMHQSVRIVKAARSRILGLKRENSQLMVKIDEIRLINRAKCALMQYLKFTEPEAHRYIEKQAMDTRSTRKEVALRILSTYES